MTDAYRKAVGRHQIAEELEAAFFSHIACHAVKPFVIRRLNGESAFPLRIEQIRVGFWQFFPFNLGGVVGLHENKNQGGCPFAMRGQHAVNQVLVLG